VKKLFVIICLLFSASILAGENPGKGTVLLSGKIIDSQTGEALAGVKIQVKGTNLYCYSDLEGNFSLQANTASTSEIAVDMVGYEPATFKSVQLSLSAPLSLNPR
jgi:hypothetical protein